MPHKDVVKRREYGKSWIARVRCDWLKKQKCSLCGHRNGLSVFKHMGSPELYWTLKGPNHEEYRVVCSAASECLRRRVEFGEKGATPDPAVVSSHKRKGKYKKPLKRDELPIMVERHAKARTRLEKDLAKPDKRPECPEHGPKGTMRYEKRVRFVCCGREVL